MHNEQLSSTNTQPQNEHNEQSGQSNLPIAFPFVPPQHFTNRYSDDDAIIRGTLFPELDLPFKNFTITTPLNVNTMTDKMKIDFICLELKLYLDTHPHDLEALEYYREYAAKSRQMKETERLESEQPGRDNWVLDPWPWE